MSRQDIRVQLVPDRVQGGATRTIRIRAFCPVPQGGTEYRATARSDAFTGVVTLTQPPPASPATSSSPVTTTTSAAPPPEVRGFALLDEDAEPGRYQVEVKCEGTNDVGKTTLTVTAKPKPTATPTRTRVVPTSAPRAGGGGTAAGGDPADQPTGIPAGVAVLALIAALGGGIAIARHRSKTG